MYNVKLNEYNTNVFHLGDFMARRLFLIDFEAEKTNKDSHLNSLFYLVRFSLAKRVQFTIEEWAVIMKSYFEVMRLCNFNLDVFIQTFSAMYDIPSYYEDNGYHPDMSFARGPTLYHMMTDCLDYILEKIDPDKKEDKTHEK
jgi:hypothetical protein